MTYVLPTGESHGNKFENLFDALSQNLDKFNISSFGVSDTTLEEVSIWRKIIYIFLGVNALLCLFCVRYKSTYFNFDCGWITQNTSPVSCTSQCAVSCNWLKWQLQCTPIRRILYEKIKRSFDCPDLDSRTDIIPDVTIASFFRFLMIFESKFAYIVVGENFTKREATETPYLCLSLTSDRIQFTFWYKPLIWMTSANLLIRYCTTCTTC